jgi:hypothetical protein
VSFPLFLVSLTLSEFRTLSQELQRRRRDSLCSPMGWIYLLFSEDA